MERKIGETFEFEGKTYVTHAGEGCEGCAFKYEDCSVGKLSNCIGECCPSLRKDHKSVIFVQVDKEGKEVIPAIEEGKRKETKSILEEAIEIVNGSRRTDYGDPVESFKRIAQMANLMSNSNDFTPVKCCIVLMATKLTRESNAHKRDNLVDLAGYGCIKQFLEEDKENE